MPWHRICKIREDERQEWLEQANEAALDEAIAYEMERDTAIADSLVQQGEWPDPRDYAGLR